MFFPDNDDDNDDIGDGDDCNCDDVGEDNGDIDDGSCSCGQVELMQKGTNGDADDEEPFHDIGQSGDRHCREALQYNEHLLLYPPHFCAFCYQGQIDCAIEQRKM